MRISDWSSDVCSSDLVVAKSGRVDATPRSRSRSRTRSAVMKAPRMILRTVDAYASLDKRRGDSLSCQSWRQLPSCVGSCAADAHEVFQRSRRNTGDADEHQTDERAAETRDDVDAGKAADQFEIVSQTKNGKASGREK